jgi:hypothetical protein
MRRQLLVGVATALLALANTVIAYPNLNATTGLIGVPTANVVAPKTLAGAADIVFFDDTVLNVRAIYGITDRFEGGVGVVMGDDSGLILNAKYLLPTTLAKFNWSAGLSYMTADDPGDGFQLYFVGTRAFPSAAPAGTRLLGTLGLSFTNMDDTSALRPFVGGQLLFNPQSELGVEFELEAGDFDESIFSLYYRRQFNSQWAGQIGFTNANGFVGKDDHSLFIGAAYSFAGNGISPVPGGTSTATGPGQTY